MALVGEKRLVSRRCFEETHPTCTAHLRCSPVKRQRTIAATSGGIGSGSDFASLLAGERGAEVDIAVVLRRRVQILSLLLPRMAYQDIEKELMTANGDLELALERLGQLHLNSGGGRNANDSAIENGRDDPSAIQQRQQGLSLREREREKKKKEKRVQTAGFDEFFSSSLFFFPQGKQIRFHRCHHHRPLAPPSANSPKFSSTS